MALAGALLAELPLALLAAFLGALVEGSLVEVSLVPLPIVRIAELTVVTVALFPVVITEVALVMARELPVMEVVVTSVPDVRSSRLDRAVAVELVEDWVSSTVSPVSTVPARVLVATDLSASKVVVVPVAAVALLKNISLLGHRVESALVLDRAEVR